MTSKVKNFLRETEAATSVEYAVMLMLIAGVCIGALQLLGGAMSGLWNDHAEVLSDITD